MSKAQKAIKSTVAQYAKSAADAAYFVYMQMPGGRELSSLLDPKYEEKWQRIFDLQKKIEDLLSEEHRTTVENLGELYLDVSSIDHQVAFRVGFEFGRRMAG